MKAESLGQPSISTLDRFWGTAAKWRKHPQRKEKSRNTWGARKIRTKDCLGLQPSGCAWRGVDLMVWRGIGASLHSVSRAETEDWTQWTETSFPSKTAMTVRGEVRRQLERHWGSGFGFSDVQILQHVWMLVQTENVTAIQWTKNSVCPEIPSHCSCPTPNSTPWGDSGWGNTGHWVCQVPRASQG